MIFKDEEGKRHSFQYDSFYALDPQYPRDKWSQDLYKYPNIMGNGFFEEVQAKDLPGSLAGRVRAGVR